MNAELLGAILIASVAALGGGLTGYVTVRVSSARTTELIRSVARSQNSLEQRLSRIEDLLMRSK